MYDEDEFKYIHINSSYSLNISNSIKRAGQNNTTFKAILKTFNDKYKNSSEAQLIIPLNRDWFYNNTFLQK